MCNPRTPQPSREPTVRRCKTWNINTGSQYYCNKDQGSQHGPPETQVKIGRSDEVDVNASVWTLHASVGASPTYNKDGCGSLTSPAHDTIIAGVCAAASCFLFWTRGSISALQYIALGGSSRKTTANQTIGHRQDCSYRQDCSLQLLMRIIHLNVGQDWQEAYHDNRQLFIS